MTFEGIMDLVAVSLGAVGGALARYGVTKWERTAAISPWNIVGVNTLGSFVLGAASSSKGLSDRARLLVGVGFCGSFTTFSTYTVYAAGLMKAKDLNAAGMYLFVSNVAGILAAILGARLLPSEY
ncbi:hypothetical protein NDN08_006088 [Rhodosorus marinus]|uniref:Fluoride ion transporter CrcB n=1 Tax=Rhodosorus marinus TaxID=101924 RepID=A0AAV8UNV5_9RHOD|nr:hypothetical protein NDN08_006088 [Rhodosorus marinus]